jgi:hypothetical protein
VKQLVLTVQVSEARAQRLETMLSASNKATALEYSSVSRDSGHPDDTNEHPVLSFLFSAPMQLTPMQLIALFTVCETFKVMILDLIYVDADQEDEAEAPAATAQRRLAMVAQRASPVRLIVDNTSK